MKTVNIAVLGNNASSYSRSIIPKAKKELRKSFKYSRALCNGILHDKTKKVENPIKKNGIVLDTKFWVSFDLLSGVEAFLY